jgi:hypothetical protein
VDPWGLGLIARPRGYRWSGLLIRIGLTITGIPVPEGEPTRGDLLTVRYGEQAGPSATVSATVTASRPLGVKFSPCV